MRRRLLNTYLSLLGVVLVSFLVPLAITIASRETQGVFIDRVDDTSRFAAIAEPALRTSRVSALQAEISEYDKVYDIGVAIVEPDGVPRIASGPNIDTDDPAVRAAVNTALSGTRAPPHPIVWPWHTGPMVVAEPIGNTGAIEGVAVSVSPTGALRASIWRQWALLFAVGLMILVVGALIAVPLTQWLTRPLHELDEVTHAMSRGELTVRVHDDTGPPELRRFAGSFNIMADRLATLVERQRGFISYASHQLRTPLATVRLRVENLGDSVPADATGDHQATLEEVDRLAEIFESLLAFARTGAELAELTTVDAGAIADARVVSWQAKAAEAGARLSRSGAETVPALAAAQTLDQVLDALIDNAIKVGAEHIEVVVLGGADTVDVWVRDDGPGMTDEELTHATEPFWRNRSDHRVAGAGLGLAIVHALITASGGTLSLYRVQPHGLAARIRLAVAERPPDEGHQLPEAAETGRAAE